MEIILDGTYAEGHGTVSNDWKRVINDHVHEFRRLLNCHPGSFNVQTDREYVPPNDYEFREKAKALSNSRGDGNHVSPCARVIKINEMDVACWIYRGGHQGENILELLCEVKLADRLKVNYGDRIKLVVEEVVIGTAGMPSPPC